MSPPRLSAVDASFLYLEQPRTPMHVGAVGIFRAPAGGFDYERLVETVERRLVAGAPVPAEGAPRPGRAGPPGLGRRCRLRRRLPRPPLGAAPAGHLRAAHGAGGAADVATAGPRPPAVGGLPRRGARRRPVRDHHEDPPGDGRRRHHDRHRAGAARPDARAARGARPAVDAAPRAERRPRSSRRGRRGRRPARSGGRHRAGRGGRRARRGGQAGARGRCAGRHGRDRGPAGAGHRRSTSTSPPSAGSPSPAATSPRTGRSAPLTGAR